MCALTVSEIYALSFARICELTGIRGDSLSDKVRRRMVHACGDPDIAEHIIIKGNLERSLTALARGCAVIMDSAMGAAAIMKKFLPPGSELICALEFAAEAIPAEAMIPTRSALAMEAVSSRLTGSVVVIGNAPTALERLLYGVAHEGWAAPALLIATPVGFVGAVESKLALCESDFSGDYITLPGRKGGSAMGAAAANALLLHASGDRHG